MAVGKTKRQPKTTRVKSAAQVAKEDYRKRRKLAEESVLEVLNKLTAMDLENLFNFLSGIYQVGFEAGKEEGISVESERSYYSDYGPSWPEDTEEAT